MKQLKLVTWNINSVRLRHPQIAEFAKLADPDVICIQEIKCTPDQFPYKAFQAMGYEHIHVIGQKGLHGVAIASRLPIDIPDQHKVCPKGEARFQRVIIAGIEFQNFYIPAGGDEPDVEINPRFAHKLEFLKSLEDYVCKRSKENAQIVLVGDLNIAPCEHDVWSHKQLLKVISHTPVETEALNRIIRSGQFIDVARELIPEPEKLYTWWSYRNRDWRKSNRGRRLDHIWVSPSLKSSALGQGREGLKIWNETRDWEKPSDHAPVSLTLKL